MSATVSLDGVDGEYAWFRGAGGSNYARALQGVSELARASIAVTVNISLHNGLLGKARELAGALNGRGLASVSVTSPMVQGRLSQHLDEFTAITHDTVEGFADTMALLMDCPVSLRVPRCDANSCPSGRSVFLDAVAYWDVLFKEPRPAWASKLGPGQYQIVFLCEHNEVRPHPDTVGALHLARRDALAGRLKQMAPQAAAHVVRLAGAPQERLHRALGELERVA